MNINGNVVADGDNIVISKNKIKGYLVLGDVSSGQFTNNNFIYGKVYRTPVSYVMKNTVKGNKYANLQFKLTKTTKDKFQITVTNNGNKKAGVSYLKALTKNSRLSAGKSKPSVNRANTYIGRFKVPSLKAKKTKIVSISKKKIKDLMKSKKISISKNKLISFEPYNPKINYSGLISASNGLLLKTIHATL